MAKKINRSLLKKAQCLLSNAQLDKSFWTEAIVYASHLINGLSSTAIRGKTSLKVWSEKAAQDHSLLRIFESRAYFSAKDRSATKEVCVFGCQKKYERLQVMGPRKQEDRVESACHI